MEMTDHPAGGGSPVHGLVDTAGPCGRPWHRARLAASLQYARDVSEVLFLQRLRAAPVERGMAGEAATVVRQARFHAHARIPNLEPAEIVARLSPEPVVEVTLPGPREKHGVGGTAYYHAVASVVRAVEPSSILEFGTFLGVGTLTLALNAPPGCRTVTVDLPDEVSVDDAHGLNQADRELIERRRDRTGEAFAGSRVADRIEQVRADSLTWRPDASLGPFDLVLIDGGHSTAVVRADTENALRLLSPTGTILWDDYFHLYPDVVGYLDGLAAAGRRLFAVRGTNLVISDPRL